MPAHHPITANTALQAHIAPVPSNQLFYRALNNYNIRDTLKQSHHNCAAGSWKRHWLQLLFICQAEKLQMLKQQFTNVLPKSNFFLPSGKIKHWTPITDMWRKYMNVKDHKASVTNCTKWERSVIQAEFTGFGGGFLCFKPALVWGFFCFGGCY